MSSKTIKTKTTGQLRQHAPNPQGKGVVGFLRDWDYSAPRGVVAKPSALVLADYFTSLLVLSAAFKFEPAFGKDYYLYWDESEFWTLSLISPQEWNKTSKHLGFVGTCTLHEDATWSITPSDNLSTGGPVADAVSQFFDGFVERLNSEEPLESGLPIYEKNLPYYQRLFAAALSRSVKGSLTLGGQRNQPASTWLERLPANANKLLGDGS